VFPILLVVTVPARVLLGKLHDPWWSTWLIFVLLAASVLGLVLSRQIFQWSLRSYRSASS